MELWSLPDVLIIQIKRFEYDMYADRYKKLNHDVAYPLLGLDLRPFLARANKGQKLPTATTITAAVAAAAATQQQQQQQQRQRGRAVPAGLPGAPGSRERREAEEEERAAAAIFSRREEGEGCLYDLYAVCNHYGVLGR